MGVPARLLAVLDDEELVLHGAAQDVSLAAGVHGIKRIRARLGEFTALGPSQRIALIVGITHWAAPEVVVTTVCHDVPAAGMMALAAPILIVGIIKVGQAQHMRELVSHGADALHGDGVRRRLKAVQLGRARITVDFLAVIRRAGPTQIRCVRPQIAAVVTRIARTVSGYQKIHHVDLAVMVVVIAREIHITVGLLQGIVEDDLRVTVALGRTRLHGNAVLDIRRRIRAIHVKGRSKRSIRLVVEVVANAARARHVTVGDRVMVPREARAAEHLAVERLRIFAGKFLVREVQQDYQTAKVLKVKVRHVNGATGTTHVTLSHCGLVNHTLGQRSQQGPFVDTAVGSIVCEHLRGYERHAVTLGIHVSASIVQHDGVAIGSGIEMIEFIAHEANRQHRAVGLRHLH